MIGTWAQRLWRHVPARCAVCHAWPTRPICDSCVQQFAQPQPRCETCALPIANGQVNCGACLTAAHALDRCIAAVSYEYPWSGLIAQFKFGGQPGWAGPLVQLLRSTPWVEPTLEACDVVLPMPLSARRLRERGYNQAHELVRRLAPAKSHATLLLRTRDTRPQPTLGRAERLRNVRGAFQIDPLRRNAVDGRRVVLVDDVMTSGASLYSAAAVLREAGARHIAALVVARTDAPGQEAAG